MLGCFLGSTKTPERCEVISGADQATSKAVEFIAAGQVIEVRPSSVGKSTTKALECLELPYGACSVLLCKVVIA